MEKQFGILDELDIDIDSKTAQEQKDIREKEEEEYQNFIESKKEEEKKPIVVDSSSQAGMVKELFNGKYVE